MLQGHQEPEHDSTADTPPGTPRWVKLFGLLALILLLLFVIFHLTGNAPMRHTV